MAFHALRRIRIFLQPRNSPLQLFPSISSCAMTMFSARGMQPSLCPCHAPALHWRHRDTPRSRISHKTSPLLQGCPQVLAFVVLKPSHGRSLEQDQLARLLLRFTGIAGIRQRLGYCTGASSPSSAFNKSRRIIVATLSCRLLLLLTQLVAQNLILPKAASSLVIRDIALLLRSVFRRPAGEDPRGKRPPRPAHTSVCPSPTHGGRSTECAIRIAHRRETWQSAWGATAHAATQRARLGSIR